MNKKQSNLLLGAVSIVTIASILLLILYIRPVEHNILKISFLDVGQGDAIFIQAPNKKQILVDGGPDGTILRQLGNIMPFYDRSIDMLIATHPDQDHIGGLADVIQNFSVDTIMRSSITSDTSTFTLINKIIKNNNVTEVIAKRGMRIHLDDKAGIYIDVLHPAYDVTQVRDKNDASVVLHVVYGETEFLLTGDASRRIEHELVTKGLSVGLASDILKLGHHGSKTASSLEFLQAVSPEFVIVSAGCDNRYGHPHQDVTSRVKKLNIKIIDTCSHGTIVMESDGTRIFIK